MDSHADIWQEMPYKANILELFHGEVLCFCSVFTFSVDGGGNIAKITPLPLFVFFPLRLYVT